MVHDLEREHGSFPVTESGAHLATEHHADAQPGVVAGAVDQAGQSLRETDALQCGGEHYLAGLDAEPPLLVQLLPLQFRIGRAVRDVNRASARQSERFMPQSQAERGWRDQAWVQRINGQLALVASVQERSIRKHSVTRT